MSHDERLSRALRALARLLDYPSPELGEHLPLLHQTLEASRRLKREDLAQLAALAGWLGAQDLMEAQGAYVDTFDRGRAASLHLFEHVHGESRDRGQAMVDLLQTYAGHGLELETQELPDYLPAFLEYASLLDGSEAVEALGEIEHILTAVGGTLARRQSPYAAVFQALLRLAGADVDAAFRGPAPADDDRSFEAIDKAWVEEPVTFMGSPCPTSGTGMQTQTIQFHRRTAA